MRRPVVALFVLLALIAVAVDVRLHRRLTPQQPAPVTVPATEPVAEPPQPRDPLPVDPIPIPPAPPPAPRQPPGPPAAAAAAARDPTASLHPGNAEHRPVIAGVTALRHDHDPVSALRLFDYYLHRHPNGDLAEDALALSIEAAVAARDPRRTQTLVRRYLSQYPSGHFTDLARDARLRFGHGRGMDIDAPAAR